jgi:hypothetical protein
MLTAGRDAADRRTVVLTRDGEEVSRFPEADARELFRALRDLFAHEDTEARRASLAAAQDRAARR